MTAIILKQNRFLKNSKHRIIHNLNDIDLIVEISLEDDVDMDMEVSRVIIREVLYNHKDSKGAQLFELIKKTNIGGTYRVLFDNPRQWRLMRYWTTPTYPLRAWATVKIAILITDTIQTKIYASSEAYRGHQQPAIQLPFG
jgi:hypothetical protein